MAKLSLIEGIGEAYELKLNEVGIRSIEGLLDACATKKGRDALAEKTGFHGQRIAGTRLLLSALMFVLSN